MQENPEDLKPSFFRWTIIYGVILLNAIYLGAELVARVIYTLLSSEDLSSSLSVFKDGLPKRLVIGVFAGFLWGLAMWLIAYFRFRKIKNRS